MSTCSAALYECLFSIYVTHNRFQFMKACYGCLKVPNVPSTHSWTADKVKNLCVSGDLYVRAFDPLVIEDAVEGEATQPRQDDVVEHTESMQEHLELEAQVQVPVMTTRYVEH